MTYANRIKRTNTSERRPFHVPELEKRKFEKRKMETLDYQERIVHHLKWIQYALWYWIILSWISMLIALILSVPFFFGPNP